MIIRQAFKYRLRPNGDQRRGMARFAGCRRCGRGDAFRYPQGVKLDPDNARVCLPKLGWVRYRNSRPVLGQIKQATVSECAGHWYVSLQTEREVPDPVHPAAGRSSLIGVDLGVVRLATLSDGAHFPAGDSYRRHQRRLAVLQKQIKYKQRGSANWRKHVARIRKLHARIARCRADALHQTSAAICKNHAVVVVEDLNVKGMSASARGTRARPGRNVRAKSGLNRSILDQGWGEFRRQLAYKQAWSGGAVIVVAPHNTSRECPACGHVSVDNRPTQARFACTRCGHAGHADHVAAINIRRRGEAQLRAGNETMVWGGCQTTWQ